jgi:hypothetical protein
MSLSPFEAKGDSVSTSYPPLCTAILTFVMQSVFISKFASAQFFDEWDGCPRVNGESVPLSWISPWSCFEPSRFDELAEITAY